MFSLNEVRLLGNLGQDPEIRTTQGGQKVATLSIATTKSWKKDGEWQNRTEWHRVVVFAPGAVTFAEKYLSKGDRVHVIGSLQTRKWTDNTGVERYATEIVVQPYEGSLDGVDRKDGGSSNQTGD